MKSRGFTHSLMIAYTSWLDAACSGSEKFMLIYSWRVRSFEECILLYLLPKGIINISDRLWQMKSCFSHGILSYYFAQVLEEQKVRQFQCLARVTGAQGTWKTTLEKPALTHRFHTSKLAVVLLGILHRMCDLLIVASPTRNCLHRFVTLWRSFLNIKSF